MEAMRRACRDTGVLRALNEECASMLMHTMGCGMEAGVRKALQGYARHYVLRPWTIRPRQWARLTALALFNVTL